MGKSLGAVIQCDYFSCSKAFHIWCAIDQKLIRNEDDMLWQTHPGNKGKTALFCEKHQKRAKQEVETFGLHQVIKSTISLSGG